MGKRGVAIGKEGGTGIDLSSAIEDVSRWGGVLNIKSPNSKGVTIEILIPQAEENFLYPTSLAFVANMTVVVVDDDPLVIMFGKIDLLASTLRKIVLKLCMRRI